jgi:hypothetical protein
MGFFDRFKPSAPTPPKIADSQKDKTKSVAAAGSIYYVKWTNQQATMSDTAKFYNEHEANIFVEDCRRQGYYVNTWHESLHQQVQAEIELIKAELMQLLQDDTDRLKYNYNKRILALESDNDLLQSRIALLNERLEQAQDELVKAQASTSDKDNSKEQEQTKQVKRWARKILASLDCSKVHTLALELEQDKDFSNTKGNMQGRLIAYYAHKIINT